MGIADGRMHLYTGDGKGKTTAAVGLGLRAWGRGLRVALVRFLKNPDSGEVEAIAALGRRYRILDDEPVLKFSWSMNEEERAHTRTVCARLLERADALMRSGECDMLILDEALGAIQGGFLEAAEVIALANRRPASVELVLTGRNAPEELITVADYVSEIRAVKHPMDAGTGARIGVEY